MTAFAPRRPDGYPTRALHARTLGACALAASLGIHVLATTALPSAPPGYVLEIRREALPVVIEFVPAAIPLPQPPTARPTAARPSAAQPSNALPTAVLPPNHVGRARAPRRSSPPSVLASAPSPHAVAVIPVAAPEPSPAVFPEPAPGPAASASVPVRLPSTLDRATSPTASVAKADGVESLGEGVDLDALSAEYQRSVAEALRSAKHYPPAARRFRLQGRVVLGVAIDADGRIVDVRIQHSSGHAILDDAAVASVRAVKQVPAAPPELRWHTRNMNYPIEYALR